jgi:TIR domain
VSSDQTSIAVGSKWLNKIDEALRSAQVELILCRQDSVRRPWVNFEAGAGWVKGIPVVPVCHTGMRPVDLPIPLNMLQDIGATDEKGEELRA